MSLLLIWFEVIPASKNLTEVLKVMFEVINGMFIIVDDYSNHIFFSIRSAFMIFLSKIVVVFKENAPYIVGNLKKNILKLKNVPCFSHTFRLAVKAAIHSEDYDHYFSQK